MGEVDKFWYLQGKTKYVIDGVDITNGDMVEVVVSGVGTDLDGEAIAKHAGASVVGEIDGVGDIRIQESLGYSNWLFGSAHNKQDAFEDATFGMDTSYDPGTWVEFPANRQYRIIRNVTTGQAAQPNVDERPATDDLPDEVEFADVAQPEPDESLAEVIDLPVVAAIPTEFEASSYKVVIPAADTREIREILEALESYGLADDASLISVV